MRWNNKGNRFSLSLCLYFAGIKGKHEKRTIYLPDLLILCTFAENI